MVDQNGQSVPGGGWQAFVERKVEDTNFKFAARAMMIVGGALALPAAGGVVSIVVLLVGLSGDLRDVSQAVGRHEKAIEKLQTDLRLVERRQDLDSGRR